MSLDPFNIQDNIIKRHEDQLHTYTSLFSPPTPRASPSPDATDKSLRRSYRAGYGDYAGAGGGTGTGMVVPDMQDPLSMMSFPHDSERNETGGNTDADVDTKGATGNANSTLAFFDKFVSEARAASENKRRSVLDEILLHQDDPLFRWCRTGSDGQVPARTDHVDDSVENSNIVVDDESQPQETQNTENTDELVLDTAPAPRTSSPVPERSSSAAHPTHPTSSPSSTPKRSPTLSVYSLQPTLAPPLQSTDTANADTHQHPSPDPSSMHSRSDSSDSLSRSPYATLSGLHSRWMSSLRNHNPHSSHHYTPLPSSPSRSDLTPSPSPPSTSTTKLSPPRTISRPHTSPNPGTSAHARSSSLASSFSPHSTSPFASHISGPIPGAPGFIEDRYNWDKGFSDELIKELQDVDPSRSDTHTGDSDSDKNNTTDTRRVLKVKSTRETRVTTEGKESFGNGSSTRVFGKTQLTQTLIAGSGVSKFSKKEKEKDKDSGMKRTRGSSSGSVVSSGSVDGGLGGLLSNRNRETGQSGSVERGNGNGTAHETRHDGRLVSELIEKKLGSIELKGRKEMTTPVLDVVLADLLRTHLPALDRLPKSWSLVYSLDQHGISLNTLYTRCEAHTQAQAQSQARLSSSGGGSRMIGSGAGIGRPGMLVVVKDSGESLFGVWIGDGVRQSRGKGHYGSGESFMWRYRSDERNEKQLDVYRWTGKNKYVVLGEPDYISFGGGEGKYGLYLDETLYDGSSARCPTFDNQPLCSPGANKAGTVAFECVGLEVWGVGP